MATVYTMSVMDTMIASYDGKPAATYRHFTKEVARKMFEERLPNRSFKMYLYQKYIKKMNALADGQEDSWIIPGIFEAPMILVKGEDGTEKLGAGQHRLKAFIDSKLEHIIFPVAYGTERDCTLQDSIGNRSISDKVALLAAFVNPLVDLENLKVKNQCTLAILLNNAKIKAANKGKRGRKSKDAVQVSANYKDEAFLAKLVGEKFDVFNQIDPYVSNSLLMKQGPVVAAFVWAYDKMSGKKKFFDALDLASRLDDDVLKSQSWKGHDLEPIVDLYNVIKSMRNKGSRHDGNRYDMMQKALYCLNAIHKGFAIKNVVAKKEILEDKSW